jgi:MscS family membrane protein
MHIIKSIEVYIKENEDFKIDENHSFFVRLDKFNDSSIDLLVYCFVNTNVWSEYLKIKQELALNIKKIIEENNASFAFPSQSIYIEKNEKITSS